LEKKSALPSGQSNVFYFSTCPQDKSKAKSYQPQPGSNKGREIGGKIPSRHASLDATGRAQQIRPQRNEIQRGKARSLAYAIRPEGIQSRVRACSTLSRTGRENRRGRATTGEETDMVPVTANPSAHREWPYAYISCGGKGIEERRGI